MWLPSNVCSKHLLINSAAWDLQNSAELKLLFMHFVMSLIRKVLMKAEICYRTVMPVEECLPWIVFGISRCYHTRSVVDRMLRWRFTHPQYSIMVLSQVYNWQRTFCVELPVFKLLNLPPFFSFFLFSIISYLCYERKCLCLCLKNYAIKSNFI